jgi:hypothetical protein
MTRAAAGVEGCVAARWEALPLGRDAQGVLGLAPEYTQLLRRRTAAAADKVAVGSAARNTRSRGKGEGGGAPCS